MWHASLVKEDKPNDKNPIFPPEVEQEIFSTRKKYVKQIRRTELPNGIWVNTVGIKLPDFAFASLAQQNRNRCPMLYETMVFSKREIEERLAHQQYSSEDEALAGHSAMVDRFADHEQS